jgi:hypothetical protein
MTIHKIHTSLSLSLVLSLFAVSACEGRDPAISTMNEKAFTGGEGEGEGEGEAVRQIVQRDLFGTLPVENRFIDPLFTLSGNGWFAVSANFQEYASVYLRPVQTPTQTRALEIAGSSENPSGTALIGSYKSSRARQTVAVWVGRDASLPALDDVTASIIGLFVDGGEQSVDLTPDTASEQRIGDTIWTQLSATLEEGPIGWGTFYLESQADDAILVAGALAVDAAPSGSNALVRVARTRALDTQETIALQVLKDRMRDRLQQPAPRVSIR